MDLTCYLLRTAPRGPVSSFGDAIQESKLAELTQEGPIDIESATAHLYISGTFPHEPPWGRWVRAAFENVRVPSVSGASAVVLVRIERGGKPTFLAFTFGYGFTLLRPDAYRRGFGLRTALNVVFAGDDGSEAIDPARLRSIDAKRVGPTVLRSRHQVADRRSLEELDVDIRRDLLNGVTGMPMDESFWGTRVTGKNALQFAAPGSVADLGLIGHRILDAYDQDDYRVRFSFVDDMQLEDDPVLRGRLQEEVLGFIQAEQLENFGLAPPDIIDWSRVVAFRYHGDGARRPPLNRREIRLGDYVAMLKERDLFDDLSVEKLKGYSIISIDGNGQPFDTWSVWRCLYGEMEIDGTTYVLDDGDFYSVTPDYMASLDSAIGAVSVSNKDLPDWIWGTREDVYNSLAATGSSEYLLLDKRTVSVSRHTTAIEICDILTADGCFIHVKRKSDGSSSLSHLFAQGFVCGDLLVGSPEFRQKALDKIRTIASERADAEDDDSYRDRFGAFSETFVDPDQHEVVYAMLGDWSEGAASLPFFSKVMLRQVVDDLGRRGLSVSLKLVPAVYGQIAD